MILLLLFLGSLFNTIAWKKGFYSLPKEEPPPKILVRHLLGFFFVYLSSALLLPPFLALLPILRRLKPLIAFGWIQGITFALALILILAYSLTLSPSLRRKIWRGGNTTLMSDLLVGVMGWFLIFPLVSALGALIEKGIQKIYQFPSYEQNAIRFLKNAMQNPFTLIIAFVTIVLIVPVLEEFLFRGILQNFFKKSFGRKGGIILASITFALFHIAPSQGASNLSLVILLFAFACFLGYLYEKRMSLWSPIGLHMTFNLMTALRVVFVKESI